MNKKAEHAKATLSFIEVTGKALGIAQTAIKTAAAQKQAAVAKISPVVQLLLDTGLIDQQEVKQAHETLANHASSLDVVRSIVTELVGRVKKAEADLADARNAATLNQGRPVAEGNGKQASGYETADEMFMRRIVHGR